MENTEHILNPEQQSTSLHEIYKNMRDSNTILFLGAGASVQERKYMSAQIIELYEQYIGKQLEIPNIKEWIDVLSADPNFNRKHFDDFVFKLLQKIKVTEAHKILATVPWDQIITTNYDLLVEQAYDELTGTSQGLYELKPIRSLKQYGYKESNTEIKYVKLNGCMHDRSLYPFAFSSNDFDKLKSFYKNVLLNLRNLSPNVNFLSIGYSYSDAFGKELLERFDSYNFRDRKWMINVDPYANENALHFYANNKVRIVKMSFNDFFQGYKTWEQSQNETLVRKRGLSVQDAKSQYISLPPKLLLDIDGIIKQLNAHTSNRERFINDVEFYKGEEPNYNVITRGLDVLKTRFIEEFKSKIDNELKSSSSTITPIFFITGEFGIGKSTFALRLVHELSGNANCDCVAFEVIDPNKVKKEFVIDLIHGTKAKRFIIYFDEVEVESHFKTLIELQRDLSIEQIQNTDVFFIVPVRENMLEKFKSSRALSKGIELKLSGSFEESELGDLLDRLRLSHLVDFRDAGEKQRLVRKVQREYDSDSFVSLMTIVSSGRHEKNLIDSYNQLSKETQQAFLFTALLHKHKLLMPASLLKNNISSNWDDFIEKVVKAEGKGLLIQEQTVTHGTSPDLYFRTKHPLIAAKLVERFIGDKDREFQRYEKILRTIESGQSNSYLAINLLKSFIKNNNFNAVQLNKLFDAAYTKLSDEPYFLLHYATNLQFRRTIPDLKRALEVLVYAESLLEHRNHRFIHRRGVISFDLAKLYAELASGQSYQDFFVGEAGDLFYTKQLLDPFSSYSYVDYIRLLIWEIKNGRLDDEQITQRQIRIEELFELANRLVDDGLEKVEGLTALYAECLKSISNNRDYKEYLDDIYNDFRLKPLACILLYNHYFIHKDFQSCDAMVEEMEYYLENFEVIKFLFKFYGRNLHDVTTRLKFLRLSRENPQLENANSLRYNFYNFIAESYNHHFGEGRRYLSAIQGKGFSINPDFHEMWNDADGQNAVFDAIVIKNRGERSKLVKLPAMQQNIRLKKGDYENLVEGHKVKVILHFYLFGLIAEVVNPRTSDVNYF